MSASKNEHAVFPQELIREGLVLNVNLYVYLPHNQTLIHYRKPGEMIGSDNIASLKKVPSDQLLYPKAESDLLYKMGGDALTNELRSGADVATSKVIQSTAAGLLRTLNEGTTLHECLDRAGTLVQTLVRDFKKSVSVNAYDEALKLTLENSVDPLTVHHNQVSVLSVLMALAVGDFSMDDITDLAVAGLVHDLGLKMLSPALYESHFGGVKQMTEEEKAFYMQHIHYSIEMVKKHKINLTAGIQRIIEHHHECWDGVGFNRLVGNKIYRPARILRLADDLISVIQGSNYALGFESGLTALRRIPGHYDPLILDTLVNQSKHH